MLDSWQGQLQVHPCDMLLTDGTNVNHALVKAGGCWWYRKYTSENAQLECAEVEAQVARLGLWDDRQPVPP